MTEWAVVGVIIALVGLVAAVAGPMLKLNTTLVNATLELKHLKENLKEALTQNTDAHKRLWKEIDRHDEQIKDHDRRIQRIEDKREAAQHGDNQ